MIEPGQRVELHYPDSTIIQADANFRRRKLHVHQLRDLLRQPLTPEEFLRRPLIRRSRWLTQAFDEEEGVWRRFYLGSSREFETHGDLRIAMFEPGEQRPWRIVSRGFRESRKERILLAKVLHSIRTEDLGDLQLRVIADDLRRIS